MNFFRGFHGIRVKALSLLPFIVFLAAFFTARLSAQDDAPRWSLVTRVSADVPIMPKPFQTYWKTTAGTGMELVWFVRRNTGLSVGMQVMPFRIDRESWKEALQNRLEGSATIDFREGSLRVFSACAGLKQVFPFVDRPFSFFIRISGEYASLVQKELVAEIVFPEAAFGQKLKLGQSHFVYGGCAGLGAEIRLSGHWGMGVEGAFHYFGIQPVKEPSPDYLIRTLIPPDQKNRGFMVVSFEWIYYFGLIRSGR